MSVDILQVRCDACNEVAHEPFIECCECDTNMCRGCFATGKEPENHKNDHKYAVRRNDFTLFDNCNWTAKEECKLLSAISTYGFGNWEEVSKVVHTRSKLECQEHYKKYYIQNVQCAELKFLPETEQSLFPKPVTPFLYNLQTSLNPPRNNQSDQHLAGYNAYRSEFELSYDHTAENIFSIEDGYSEEEEDDECMEALKVSLVNALNTRLRERQRRYSIIQNHGLIMPNKYLLWVKKFDDTLMRSKTERLASFMQFMTGMQFDAFMESLSLEDELLRRIFILSEFRKNGIKTLHSARLYQQLKKEKALALKEQKCLTSIMQNRFENQSPVKVKKYVMIRDTLNNKMRRTSLPLDIVDLPGFHLLLDSEKALCSNLRLVPTNYLEIKKQLIAENNKSGFLKLLEARRVLKIDVNKTRKIYDYLLEEGFINSPINRQNVL